MSDGTLDTIDVANLIRRKFGSHARVTMNREQGHVSFVLYDAFEITGDIDDYGSGGGWGFAIRISDREATAGVFGRSLALNETSDDVVSALDRIDHYCRLRLGDAYLAEFERAYPRRESL